MTKIKSISTAVARHFHSKIGSGAPAEDAPVASLHLPTWRRGAPSCGEAERAGGSRVGMENHRKTIGKWWLNGVLIMF